MIEKKNFKYWEISNRFLNKLWVLRRLYRKVEVR